MKNRGMRVGVGYDVHRLTAGRRLVIGGVEIPFETGLDGHSDADVLCHAVTDAILGAAALGNIGTHFPNSELSLKNISSIELLKRANSLVLQAGWTIVNVDSTVSIERPKLAPHIPAMREAIASALGTDAANVSVKATSGEGIGFVGTGQGVAAHAVALVESAGEPAGGIVGRGTH